jgi:hypothetical protein
MVCLIKMCAFFPPRFINEARSTQKPTEIIFSFIKKSSFFPYILSALCLNCEFFSLSHNGMMSKLSFIKDREDFQSTRFSDAPQSHITTLFMVTSVHKGYTNPDGHPLTEITRPLAPQPRLLPALSPPFSAQKPHWGSLLHAAPQLAPHIPSHCLPLPK